MKLPPYAIFPTLSGNTISLRPIQFADMNDLIEISFYDAVQATSVEQAIAMQTRIDKDYIDGNSIHWGIADNVTHKIVGTCGYYRGLNKDAGELGCVLLPQYRGKGYMFPAMQLAIDFGINTIGLNRIWATTTQQNDKAIQLLHKLGFVKIADLQEHEVEYELRLTELTKQ